MKRAIAWTLRVLLALAFLASAYAKLSGNPQAIEGFDKIGLGQWFRYFTGLTEASAAILLLIPATGLFGALLIVATMIGAVTAHLTRLGGNPAGAIVMGVLAAVVVYLLRPGADKAGADKAREAPASPTV